MLTIRRLVVAALVTALLAVGAVAAPAALADSPQVEVAVDNQTVEDGDTVEVQTGEVFATVNVSSEIELNKLTSTLHQTEIAAGITGNSHYTEHYLTVRPGSNVYSVVAEDIDGNTGEVTVDLYAEPTNAVELRDALRQLEDERDRLEEDIERLREREEELAEANEDLLDEREARDDEQEPDNDDAEGLPGFTVLAALVATAVGFGIARRADTD